MRPAVLALTAALAMMAGCVDAGIDTIEQARRERGFGVEESTTPTPTPRPGPAASPPPPTSARPTPVTTSSPTPVTTPSPTPVTTPSPTPTPAPRPWPSEGSYVRAVADGPEGRAYLNWTYNDEGWLGTCERAGERTVRFGPESPPHWPLFNTREVPAVGEEVEVWWSEDCALQQRGSPYAGFADGAHEAGEPGFETRWDAASGLVLTWTQVDNDSWSVGQMYATDARLGAGPR